MRGRKRNTEYVSQYIEHCMAIGINDKEEILSLAKEELSNLDEMIHKLENLKKLRPKLNDVIESLSK